MNENTIIFTPWAQFRHGWLCIAKGVACVAVAIWRATATAVAVTSIAQARAERDALNKRNYQLEQRIRRMQTALGIDDNLKIQP